MEDKVFLGKTLRHGFFFVKSLDGCCNLSPFRIPIQDSFAEATSLSCCSAVSSPG